MFDKKNPFFPVIWGMFGGVLAFYLFIQFVIPIGQIESEFVRKCKESLMVGVKLEDFDNNIEYLVLPGNESDVVCTEQYAFVSGEVIADPLGMCDITNAYWAGPDLYFKCSYRPDGYTRSWPQGVIPGTNLPVVIVDTQCIKSADSVVDECLPP